MQLTRAQMHEALDEFLDKPTTRRYSSMVRLLAEWFIQFVEEAKKNEQLSSDG